MTVRIMEGDCRDVLKTLPDESVHCVITSPPYFGLRDYGVAGQIGLEGHPDAFVNQLVAVFAEVRRVLRTDGTLWLNLGDSYSNGSKLPGGIKPKDLIGIPWRVAFALQMDGWYLRQDIIWHKPNPMPESVQDRCTKAHEYIFLLAKAATYYFDASAMAEPNAEPSGSGGWQSAARRGEHGFYRGKYPSKKTEGAAGGSKVSVLGSLGTGDGRNKRSVWTVSTQPFRGAHFATFPPALIEPCILSGCPEGGTVLDPFGGAGTAGLVANRHKRNAVLIELNPEYAALAQKRIVNEAPLFAEVI